MENRPGSTGLLTIKQAAELLHVPVELLRRWDQEGRLKAVRLGPRGLRRYRIEDIVRMQAGDAPAPPAPPVPLLPALSALLRIVASTLDEREIGQTVVDEAVKLLHADRSAIYFFDDDRTTMLPFVATDTRDPTTVETLFYPNPVPVAAQPLFRELLATLVPIEVSDTYTDPRTTREFFERFDTRALVFVPLLAREQHLVGILAFFWVGGTHTFGDDELALAGALGRQAAIAFENAQLYQLAHAHAQATELEQRRQALLAEASKLFNALLAPREVLDRIARLVCEHLGDSATIMLLDPDGQHVRVAGSYQKDRGYQQIRRVFEERYPFASNPVLLNVLRTGEPIVSNHPALERTSDPAWRITSFILVPLVSQGRVFGTLGVSSIDPNRRTYNDDDLRVMVALADRAALALENARLFEVSECLRRQAEAKASQLKTVIESIADGVWVADADGAIVDVNQRGAELLGLFQKPEHVRPLSDYGILLELRYPDGTIMPLDESPLARALRRGQVVTGDMMVHNVQTRRARYLQVNAAPLRDEQGRIAGAVAVSRDITESVELIRQKDEFLSVVSHELKTPITSIKGFSQAMERRFRQKLAHYTPNELFAEQELRKFTEQLGVIVRQTNRLQRLVDDLLDLSSLETDRVLLNRARLNIAQLLLEVVDRMQVMTSTHHINATLSDDEVWVDGDETRLEQVLTNLLQNAIKYSPVADRIDVRLEKSQDTVTIAVRDYGIGVPAGDQEHLFVRFFRASNASANNYGGLGLGLYISSEIVKRHGGRMAVESCENVGSSFSFSLPLAPDGRG